jgi:hypothetical protein
MTRLGTWNMLGLQNDVWPLNMSQYVCDVVFDGYRIKLLTSHAVYQSSMYCHRPASQQCHLTSKVRHLATCLVRTQVLWNNCCWTARWKVPVGLTWSVFSLSAILLVGAKLRYVMGGNQLLLIRSGAVEGIKNNYQPQDYWIFGFVRCPVSWKHNISDTDEVSKMLYSLEYWKWAKSQNPVIQSVLHHNQNPLDSNYKLLIIM